MIRRINLFGGPGSGKSTLAHWLFSELKVSGESVEFVSEWVKEWAIEGRPVTKWDQLKILSQQLEAELRALKNGYDIIISESPLMLTAFYSEVYEFPCVDALLDIARNFEEEYPSFNVFLDREGIGYERNGRYESEDMAIKRDDDMFAFLTDVEVCCMEMPAIDRDDILKEINNALCRDRG
jgi:hypothetical protein